MKPVKLVFKIFRTSGLTKDIRMKSERHFRNTDGFCSNILCKAICSHYFKQNLSIPCFSLLCLDTKPHNNFSP